MLPRMFALPLLSAAFFIIVPAQAFPQSTDTTDALIRQSTFIFRGTVEKVGASTMPAVAANDFTAVVRVDELIDAPGAPPDLAGKSVTVKLLQANSVKAGEQLTFFTKGWLMGNSMAVIEVGRSAAAQNPSEQVRRTRALMADEGLQKQLATAEAIVVGIVRSVQPAAIRHLATEHDPDWYEAHIEVESAIRGRISGREMTIVFPHSDDVMWKRSPKFTQGERGIWLLHRNQARLPGIEDRYTALDPLDFRPAGELDRVRRLSGNER